MATRTSAPDRIFAALDGRNLLVSGSRWRVRVYGVLEETGRRWIQLAVDGPRHHMVTIALAADANIRQVVRHLSHWLADPAASDEVLTVSQTGARSRRPLRPAGALRSA